MSQAIVTGPNEAEYEAEAKGLSDEKLYQINQMKELIRGYMLGIDTRRQYLETLPSGPAVRGAIECLNNALHELQAAVSQLVGLDPEGEEHGRKV